MKCTSVKEEDDDDDDSGYPSVVDWLSLSGYFTSYVNMKGWEGVETEAQKKGVRHEPVRRQLYRGTLIDGCCLRFHLSEYKLQLVSLY